MKTRQSIGVGLLSALALTIAVGSKALGQGRCIATDMGTLGGDSTLPTDMNDSGRIVGYSTTAQGRNHGFVWDNGVLADIGTLGGPESFAHGVNGAGIVVGGSY